MQEHFRSLPGENAQVMIIKDLGPGEQGFANVLNYIDYRGDWSQHYFDISQPDELTHKIIPFLKISNDDLELIRIKMRRIADAHSLSALSKQIHSHLEFIL